MPIIAGADGCRAGWLVLSRGRAEERPSPSVKASASELIAFAERVAVLAIDIPIGLTDRGRRECDAAARAALGWPRRCSVFPAPVRPALRASTRAEASAATQVADGRRVGAQAWAIYPKIRDIDVALRKSPVSTRGTVCEVHPEVSFWAWNRQRAMEASKTSAAGKAARRRLVDQHFGDDAYPDVRARFLKKDVADDDILDAFAALWTAERVLRGVAKTLPADPPKDRLGLAMQIVY